MQYLAIAATAVNVISALSGDKKAEAQYKAKAESDRYNAAVSRQRAEAIYSVTNQREESLRRTNRTILGKSRAASAQAGLGTGGSAADVEKQNAILAELDALNIRYEGDVNAKGALQSAAISDWEAAGAMWNAKQARKPNWMGAAGAIMSGMGAYNSLSGPQQLPAPVTDAHPRIVG